MAAQRASTTLIKSNELIFKVLLIGDYGTGKTSLLCRYTDDAFNPVYVPTIGVDFKFKTIEIDKKQIKLQMWDTAGSERFKAIVTTYFKGSHGCFLVYDITNVDSFKNIVNWFELIKKESPDCRVMLIGSKSDLSMARQIQQESAENFARENDMLYLESSAKEGTNVDKMFTKLAEIMLNFFKIIEPPQEEKDERVSMVKAEVVQKKSCC
ncbi:hypothetical protein EIN_424850 [Entamoeba invadens IP1]|uniref:Uncharacterized protein n=1 Tax=Entamoeba invadens IP1 TaxID=370355 RepID=A0A0A1U5U9_ENTIV|nr:hypothetical protein EIN_424850 [Entamoeba invadens IP1]ELP89763.1 hypothetical protein EIN_424850 [Entamoeba invadens IP1]|eukprot:XP_004256534.1 hypothetical protein EIN_424850 [Entamoeba invadens IP1]